MQEVLFVVVDLVRDLWAMERYQLTIRQTILAIKCILIMWLDSLQTNCIEVFWYLIYLGDFTFTHENLWAESFKVQWAWLDNLEIRLYNVC